MMDSDDDEKMEEPTTVMGGGDMGGDDGMGGEDPVDTSKPEPVRPTQSFPLLCMLGAVCDACCCTSGGCGVLWSWSCVTSSSAAPAWQACIWWARLQVVESTEETEAEEPEEIIVEEDEPDPAPVTPSGVLPCCMHAVSVPEVLSCVYCILHTALRGKRALGPTKISRHDPHTNGRPLGLCSTSTSLWCDCHTDTRYGCVSLNNFDFGILLRVAVPKCIHACECLLVARAVIL